MKIEIKYTYCWSEGVKTHAQGGPGDKGVEATTLKMTPGSRGARRRRWCWRTAPLMRARSRLLAEPASRCCVSAFSSALAARSPFQMLGNFIRSYNSWQGGRIIWDPGGELETLHRLLRNELNFWRDLRNRLNQLPKKGQRSPVTARWELRSYPLGATEMVFLSWCLIALVDFGVIHLKITAECI